MTHYATTVIEFEDGHLEGQVLHVGEQADCERIGDSIPAVVYSGSQRILGAYVSVRPNDEGLKVGERWTTETPAMCTAPRTNVLSEPPPREP